MSSLFRKAARKLDSSIGLGIECVYLYRLLNGEAIPHLSPPPDLEILQLATGQMPRLQEVLPSLDIPEILQTQGQNSQCYGALMKDRLVHYSWVQSSGQHSILEAGRRVDITHGEFWIYDCRTSPSAQGLGIYPCMLCAIAREKMREGLREAVIYTTKENIASQRGILKAGFGLKEVLRSFRIGSWYCALK